MTDLEIVRRAAALIRERADCAVGSPWSIDPDYAHEVIETATDVVLAGTSGAMEAEHIASWHPEVARGVAALLEAEAAAGPCDGDAEWLAAVDLARLYLGEPS